MAFAYLSSFIWTPADPPMMKAIDASHSPIIRHHFLHFLDNAQPSETFSPKEVAQQLKLEELRQLGFKVWEDAIPAIYELAWEIRELGDCYILRKGKLVPEDVSIYEIDGPIRIARRSD